MLTPWIITQLNTTQCKMYFIKRFLGILNNTECNAIFYFSIAYHYLCIIDIPIYKSFQIKCRFLFDLWWHLLRSSNSKRIIDGARNKISRWTMICYQKTQNVIMCSVVKYLEVNNLNTLCIVSFYFFHFVFMVQ